MTAAMFNPLFAYAVSRGEHDEESIQRALLSTQLDECWLRIEELPQLGDRALVLIEMFDLRTGEPLNVPDLGNELSADGKFALLVGAADPGQPTGAFEVYGDGEVRFSWAGPFDSFEIELPPDGERMVGADGFAAAFDRLAGVSWDRLIEASGTEATAPDEAQQQIANEYTWLLLRGRFLALPIGMPRREELFRFHYSSDVELELVELEDGDGMALDGDDRADQEALEDVGLDPGELDQEVRQLIDQEELDEDALEEEDGDQMTMVLLDLRLANHLWSDAPAVHAANFLRALEPVQASLLGPLAHAVPRVLDYVLELDPDRPLADADAPELLAYELLAMGSAAAYLAGDSVSYYDERFFPLINLDPAPFSAEVIRASLDDIASRGILSAMVEVLPYSAPEGALLESFGDTEISPLAAWAQEGDVYEGSLFLLDVRRLIQRIEAFDFETFKQRVNEFSAMWDGILPPDGARDPYIRQLLDDSERALFRWHLQELQMMLAMSQVNRLQPALFFYERPS